MSGVTQFTAASPLALLWALPFLGLLASFATLPLAAPNHWHRQYRKWAAFWALAFILPATAQRGGPILQSVLGAALHEYLPFILLLVSLYVVTGGIHITGSPRGNPAINTLILAFGTVLAGVIGTMGAALLLVRPLIRANRGRKRRAHLMIFFILLVANIGGAFSPLGNPPLLLGYLAGVPFLWPFQHLWLPTAVLALGLLASFFVIDWLLGDRNEPLRDELVEAAKFNITGKRNLVLLAGVIAAVLLENLWPTPAAISWFGVEWRLPEIVSDALYILLAVLSLRLTGPRVRHANEFNWAPIEEVAVLFAAIFVTLIPVIGMIAAGTDGPAAPLFAALMRNGTPDYLRFFAITGLLSAFLDNAPTYLVFFDFAGGDPARLTHDLSTALTAISAGAVYFGALSYIGNAPNLMIKSLAESHGVPMPSFFAYTGLAALIAGPWFALVAVLFFA
jgi:Na+/H+ antiporter NhaD/arsenite permease-like protein